MSPLRWLAALLAGVGSFAAVLLVPGAAGLALGVVLGVVVFILCT